MLKIAIIAAGVVSAAAFLPAQSFAPMGLKGPMNPQQLRAPPLQSRWSSSKRFGGQSIRMQADFQWNSFAGYNLGLWKGRALHIDPETGDYFQPYIIRNYELKVVETGTESGTQKFKGFESASLEAMDLETPIVPDDNFDADPDGAYSLDGAMMQVPDYDRSPSLSIEMALPISDGERVRCQLLYDLDAKLDRIILFEESRAEGETVSQPAQRSPLGLMDFVGSYSGESVSRRSWRIGGGHLRFKSKGNVLWDGESRLRREMEILDSNLNASRVVTWGSIDDPYSNVCEFDGSRLVFLPGGCWVSAPAVLLDADGEPIKRPSALDILKEAGFPQSVEPKDKVSEVLKSVGGADSTKGTFQSYVAEFGIILSDTSERKSMRRIYDQEGRIVSTTTALEVNS